MSDYDSYEEELEDNSYEEQYSSGEPREETNSVMRNFFNTANYLKKKIAYWQGYTLTYDGKYIETHEPVAPDSFIYSIVGIIDSVVNQHNSVSFINDENANRIKYECITAFNQTVLNEPLFNPDRYLMLVEEFDHLIELFMGLVINGHGKLVATALQAGVISEYRPHEQKPQSVFDRTKDMLNKKI